MRDYLCWQTQDRKTLKRINALLKDLERGNFDSIGKPEPVSYTHLDVYKRQPQPSLETGAQAWILAGGAHHTAFSYDLTVEPVCLLYTSRCV